MDEAGEEIKSPYLGDFISWSGELLLPPDDDGDEYLFASFTETESYTGSNRRDIELGRGVIAASRICCRATKSDTKRSWLLMGYEPSPEALYEVDGRDHDDVLGRE